MLYCKLQALRSPVVVAPSENIIKSLDKPAKGSQSQQTKTDLSGSKASGHLYLYVAAHTHSSISRDRYTLNTLSMGTFTINLSTSLNLLS